MTSVEMMTPELGDGLIDVAGGFGVGFDQSSIMNVQRDDRHISFDLHTPNATRGFLIRFRNLVPTRKYTVRCNAQPEQTFLGSELLASGLRIDASKKSETP